MSTLEVLIREKQKQEGDTAVKQAVAELRRAAGNYANANRISHSLAVRAWANMLCDFLIRGL
jgi:hypothetical protein